MIKSYHHQVYYFILKRLACCSKCFYQHCSGSRTATASHVTTQESSPKTTVNVTSGINLITHLPYFALTIPSSFAEIKQSKPSACTVFFRLGQHYKLHLDKGILNSEGHWSGSLRNLVQSLFKDQLKMFL